MITKINLNCLMLCLNIGISEPIANDNCDEQILGVPNDFQVDGVATIEWIFIDSSNNTAVDILM